METMNKRFVKSLCTIAVAILLFVIGCINSIEIIGKWEISKVGGMSMKEFYKKEFSLDYLPVKGYTEFQIGGTLKPHAEVTAKAKKELSSAELKYVEGLFVNIESIGAKYGIKGGKLFTGEDKIDYDDDDGMDFSVGFNRLEYEVDGEPVTFKRAGLGGFICPSILLKVIAVILLIIGIRNLLKADSSESARKFSFVRCPKCGASVSLDNSFCTECGAAMHKAATSDLPPSPLCTNCGAPLSPDASFCTECGAPIANTKESTTSGTAHAVIAKENDTHTASSVSTLKSTFAASSDVVGNVEEIKTEPRKSVLKSTFKTHATDGSSSTPSDTFTPGVSSTSSAKVSENEHFQSAGDL